MRALVVYDTKFGNTEKVARAIAAALGPEVRAARAETISPEEIEGLDLLVVGSPTQAWSASRPTKVFLSGLPRGALSGVRAAAFDTGFTSRFSGSAAKKIERALRQRGCTIVAPATRFFVKGTEGPLLEGELDRAAAWANQILEGAERRSGR
ncbi:MAG: flavodoxin family protein [Candidatus Acetothermia bacterium]|jgi:flavodoxin|nr:flavodoxin family protein [Candidatus Acetothermia bacterium]MDH7504629.1 flavodoxin family protein [Candidatus Acetothermia bacterium]